MTVSSQKLTDSSTDSSQMSVAGIAGRARAASRSLAKLSNKCRNEVLLAAAQAIEDAGRKILEANASDCRAAEPAVAAGKMSSAMLARLQVSERGVG